MKKILFLSCLLIAASTHATSTHLECPHEVSLTDLNLNREDFHQRDLEATYDYLCQDSDLIYDILAAPLFRTELNRFHKNILIPAYRDNISNPNFMADKLTLETRKHHMCLRDVCRAIFNKCRNTTGSDQNIRQGSQCSQSEEALLKLSWEKAEAIALHNQARKERTYHRQKNEALFTRFQIFTHAKFLQVVDLMDRFVEKVTYLIPDPEHDKGRP